MTSSSSIRLGVALALAGAAACSDLPVLTQPLQPSAAAGARAASSATTTTDENVVVSPVLAAIDARLASVGANVRVVNAALRIAADSWNGVTGTLLVANDRTRSIGADWVKGDPRRDGRIGVTYAIGSNSAIAPTTRAPNGANVRLVTAAERTAWIDESMAGWRDLVCSDAPITKVSVPAGTDPDLIDELVRGQAPSGNYAQPADIVHSGWQSRAWFQALAGSPAAGDAIIGVTIPFAFVDGDGNFTDIDRDGKADLALAELYYNARFYWGSIAPNVVDYYSIIAHESGHALGLAHFGKVFITKPDLADGITLSDIKYAPYALMNAVYVTGRNEIAGTDQSQFCQMWAGR